MQTYTYTGFTLNFGQFNKLRQVLISKNMQTGILQNETYMDKYLAMEAEGLTMSG
jgi:hypothetical protein